MTPALAKKLSILYLRCATVAALQGMNYAPFNSLFEMPHCLRRADAGGETGEAFNSLFEMP